MFRHPLFFNHGIRVDNFTRSEINQVGFLSHAHSDHTSGLYSTKCEVVYTTKLTKLLLASNGLGAERVSFRIMRLGTVYAISPYIKAVALESNHCPGSCMFIFMFVKERINILFTGDFRMGPGLYHDQFLQKLHFDCVLYDDTFVNIDSKFPSYNDTYVNLKQRIKCLRAQKGPGVNIFIDTSILGFEIILIKYHKETGEYFRIGNRLSNTRKAQLRLVMGDYITEDVSCICLSSGKLTKPDEVWVYPTSVRFICEYSRDSSYIWFSAHATDAEILELQNITRVSIDNMVPCGFSVLPLGCMKK